ncbi:MAG: PepSY domain-containing protein [Rhizobiaceae bacterium]|nr:PepSY domain-containing protein [Rhizobiaceae bacterium]
MKRNFLALGALALGFVAFAAPALSQGIEIGPNGVRILEPRDRIEDRRDRREDRRDDRRDRREVGEREAVRIARSEGVREVDDVVISRRSIRVIGGDRRGRDIRVDIDRRTGQVLSVR